MDTFTIESFQAALFKRFTLRAAPGQELDLELIAVHDLSKSFENTASLPGGPGRTPTRAPFSVHFRGPQTPWARQHTYHVSNDRLGDMHIFLVPLGPDGKGMLYEAIFS